MRQGTMMRPPQRHFPSMNAPFAPSLLSTIELAPRDPIIGVTEAYNADPNPHKVNLGVGVYTDENGKVPLLECVKHAEREIADSAAPRSYLPIDGIPAYDREVRSLLFGASSEVVASGRAVTVQALGGTGALKVGADFLRRFAPGAQVWISDPSWENHRALFEGAGFTVQQLSLLRRRNERPRFRRHVRSAGEAPGGLHRRAARVLPQSDRRRSDRRAVGAHRRGRPRARARSVPRSRLSGLRRRHRRRWRRRARVHRHAGPVARSRARSRNRFRSTASASARCRWSPPTATKRRACCRSSSASSAPTIRIRRRTAARSSPRCWLAGVARAVGGRARDDAQPHQADARAAGRAAARARSRRRLPLHARAARHVLVLGAHESAGAAAARGRSRSTRSTPGASAWPRSTTHNVDYVADAIAKVVA